MPQGRTRALFIVPVCLALVGIVGCRREHEPPPPPTAEQVKAGVEQTAERIRNDPKLTPEQKEQAIRALYGMASGIRTRDSGKQ